MKVGARNHMVGQITGIKKGTLMCEVTVKVPADALMASVMTLDSLEGMGVKEGDKVHVICKAVNVLLMKD